MLLTLAPSIQHVKSNLAVGRYPACSRKPQEFWALVAKSAAPIASAKAPFVLGAAWRIEVRDLGEAAFSEVLFEQHHGLLAQLRGRSGPRACRFPRQDKPPSWVFGVTAHHATMFPSAHYRYNVLSEVAELARLEPVQHQLEGLGVNLRTPTEGMVHRGYGEQNQRDHPR